MPVLVRKINVAKWRKITSSDIEDTPADAITGHCLKTSGDNLSTWKIDSKEKLTEGVLAIVSAQDNHEALDVVCFSPESLVDDGLKLEETDGRTAIKSFIKNHIDISELNYKKLGVIAGYIINEVKNNRAIRFTSSELKKLLLEALDNGLLEKDDLSDDLRDKLSVIQ